MTTAIVLFSAMTVLIRMLTADIPVHQIVFVRGVVSVLLLVPLLVSQGLGSLATRRFGLLMGRGALTSIGLLTWIYAIARI